jgi:hypothetical protein
MQLKPGVTLKGICPEMVLGLIVIDSVMWRQFQVDPVVTSCTDGRHMSGSRHYLGLAADLRTWGIEDRITSVVPALAAALGEHFDVVHESDHIHVEFDPK